MNLFQAIRRIAWLAMPFPGRSKLARQWHTYRRLRRYVPPLCPQEPPEDCPIIIWLYWAQGWENAPALVRTCNETVHAKLGGYTVVLLDDSNLNSYIDMPSCIQEKYRSGVIPRPQYSDLVRLGLLVRHGGIWMDATCFVSESFPDFILSSPMFFFQTALFERWSPIRCSNWFVKARKGEPLLLMLNDMLLRYWEKESDLWDYCIFHISISLLLSEYPVLNDQWVQMLYVSNQNPHVLQYNFAVPFSDMAFDHSVRSCFVHKLDYKYDPALLAAKQTNILMKLLGVTR